ncbi:hypothetical protein [Bacillus sp. AFS017336]|uniref:tubby C-terminal domain-like protein n=1 Tax=Bacillus sp. AFS017336 TaxID=2033489 RepID=UPI000BF223CD|nr:hypothetical protein [Bacillus sp. AFS017336]PEK98180.1 hypothetical protein CN601_26075 [Bacillus sp. AFS017336]
MHHFFYRVPRNNFDFFYEKRIINDMSIINESGESVFILQKQKHRFFANLVHELIDSGLPFCYKIRNIHGQTLFSINCAFPGFRYILIEHLSGQAIPITKHRELSTELSYTFMISNNEYFFKKDFKGVGHLICDNKEVAAVSMPFDSDDNSEFDKIIVNASSEEIAPLAVVLFHTFYYYGR